MASFSFNPFGNWFTKPPNPIPPLNLLSFRDSFSLKSSTSPNFASISISNSSKEPEKAEEPAVESNEPGYYRKMLDQFYWECENLPDYRHTPEVEKILNDDPVFEKKENPTEEERKENEEFWNGLRASPVFKFLARAEEIDEMENEFELEENKIPFHKEDREYWASVPHVPGMNGRPMPRKSIKTRPEAMDKFWDFMKQFLFGLWCFRQRPYPSGRPIDIVQVLGSKRIEKRYYDFIMRSGGFYYKDRLGRTRGPLELVTLKSAFGAGIIDKDTFIWGEDMDEWAPIHMVYGMERAINTWDVRFATAATAFLHKLQKGIPPWVPLKGREKKTYEQVQEEALESKRRDLAVLKANDGVWPGVRIPSHALFLWASGSELTSILEADHMPNKFIPKELRYKLAKLIPGLRPWEVLSIEQAMDQITYGGQWYREPLGAYRTGPPYVRRWNKDCMQLYRAFLIVGDKVYSSLKEIFPGFDLVMKKVDEDLKARQYMIYKKKNEMEEAERERLYGSGARKNP